MSTFHLFDKNPGFCDKCFLTVETIAASGERCSGVPVGDPASVRRAVKQETELESMLGLVRRLEEGR